MSYLERAITDGHAKLTGEGKQQKILYVAVNHTERYADPEEQVRAEFWAELIYRYGYEPARIGVEITVPDRTPSDQRDFSLSASTGERAGVRCRSLQLAERKKPYAVIECKADGVTDAEFNQAVEQACGNGTWAKFRANYVGVVAGMTRRLWFLREIRRLEREANIIADLPRIYGKPEEYRFYKGEPEYVEGLVEVVLTVAPYKALIDSFQELSKIDPTLNEAIGLLGKVQVAELAAYGHIVWLRIKAIKQLEKCIDAKSDELTLQELIAESPWLISPTWTPLTKNQSLFTFKKTFEAYYKEKHQTTICLAVDKNFANKRPDFVLVGVEKKIRLVELKAPGHLMEDADMARLENYVATFREFFESSEFFRSEFPDGFQIDLIVDGTNLKEAGHRNAYKDYQQLKQLRPLKWIDFLGQAEKANEKFLEVNRKIKERV